MTLTPFGIIIGIVGIILLLRAKVPAMLWLTMICALFGGSAAILLPALGGASVPPAQFALVFLVARIVLPGSGLYGALTDGLKANIFLGSFVAYGVATAMIASRLFAGTVQVVALRFQEAASLFATTPLAFSPQNITTSVYLVGTFLLSTSAFVALRDGSAATKFVKTAVIMAWIHVFFGVSGAVLKGTPYDSFINFFRNASYAQLDQVVGGIVRINGIFPEPSSYAGFGFDWFVLLFECWFRNILPRRTGPAAAALALVLIGSTSTTAYAALAIYAAIFFLRVLVFPQALPARKGLALAGAGLIGLIVVAAAALLFPVVASGLFKLLRYLTVEKQDSTSGLQRAFWAKIGLDAFVASWGIGVGPGSFRSSTIATAMIGSVGVLGTSLFLVHFLRVLKPLRITTYFSRPWQLGVEVDQAAMIGAAASWAAFGVMIPALLIAPTTDPGTDFGLFGGVALALRAARRTRPAVKSEPIPIADYAHVDLGWPAHLPSGAGRYIR